MNNFASETARRRHWAGINCAMRYHIDHGVWPSQELMQQWQYAIETALPSDESLLRDFSFPVGKTEKVNFHLTLARAALARAYDEIETKKREQEIKLNSHTMNFYCVRVTLGLLPLNPRTIHDFQDIEKASREHEKTKPPHGNITLSGEAEVRLFYKPWCALEVKNGVKAEAKSEDKHELGIDGQHQNKFCKRCYQPADSLTPKCRKLRRIS